MYERLEAMGVSLGHELACAADGLSVLELALLSAPDMLILDCGLSVMDGMSVCEAIRQDPEYGEELVLLLTGAVEPEIHALERSGANGFIEKTVGLSAMREILTSRLPPEAW